MNKTLKVTLLITSCFIAVINFLIYRILCIELHKELVSVGLSSVSLSGLSKLVVLQSHWMIGFVCLFLVMLFGMTLFKQWNTKLFILLLGALWIFPLMLLIWCLSLSTIEVLRISM